VREEKHYINVARTSNNRVISSGDLFCCLLPQCEALRTCRSGFPIATALIKLYRAIEEEDCDPLIQFFQWITMKYKLSKRQKMILLQKSNRKKNLDWKSNTADEIEAAIQEAHVTVGELTESQFLSNLMKDILRNNMPRAYYVKIAEMNIAEMLQKMPEIWKECGSPGTTFQYKKHRYTRDKHDKYHGYHAHVNKKNSDIERDCIIVADRQDIKQRIVHGIRVRIKVNEE